MANSLAIATDAAHMMTDFAGFMISLLSIYLSSRRPTKRMSFGWHRAGKTKSAKGPHLFSERMITTKVCNM